ncbi:MAG: hypothetical protein KatS3mg057_1310 [Herpetosiphonaceae bacterium]|nr:MAG: hypothetical protein KatS3mg057_1310 [Herpetosiphonaceae bacterium]
MLAPILGVSRDALSALTLLLAVPLAFYISSFRCPACNTPLRRLSTAYCPGCGVQPRDS